VLAAFPENYRLFEHRRAANNPNVVVKQAEAENSEVKEPSVEGKVPNDRRDVYLYGHPQGRKKRFRSPAEFLPHLIWLATDESGDRENCSCKLCTPDEMIKMAEEMAALQKKQHATVLKEEDRKKSVQPTPTVQNVQAKIEPPRNTAVVPAPQQKDPASQNIASPSRAASQSVQPGASQPQDKVAPSVPMGPVATPPIKALSPEQRIDQQLHKYVYRDGELVWYTTAENHLALGAIISRSLYKSTGDTEKAAYVIQPISQPYNYRMGVITTQENDIKPWLAFSLPPTAMPEVGEGEIMYEDVDWEAIRHSYTDEALLRAGSICAARMIDASYTLLEPLNGPGQGSQSNPGEVAYNGMYLGGEKIWTGEAVRLATRDDCKDIMIVSQIIERLGTSYGQSAGVDLVGDVYTPVESPYNPKRPPPPNLYLPVRVREDLKWRNSYSTKQLNISLNWKLLQGQQRVSIAQAKGRWYESRYVLPATNPPALENGEATGMIPDVGDGFNARGTGQTEIGEKKIERRQAFSKSLPDYVRFGMRFQIPQVAGKAVPIDLSAPSVRGDGNMSGFVNMDQMEQSNFPRTYMS
jgi:hypothetical protein